MTLRVLLLILLVVAGLALAAAPAVERFAVHAVDTLAARPESVSAAIEASRATGAQPAAGVPGWMVAVAVLAGLGFLLWRGGELLRQLRLTMRRRVPERRPLPLLPDLRDGGER